MSQFPKRVIDENEFLDNQTVIGKPSPFMSGLKPIPESPAAALNDTRRSRGSSGKQSNPLEYSDSEDDEVEAAFNSSLVVSTSSLDWADPEWDDTVPLQLVRVKGDTFEMCDEGKSFMLSHLKNRKIVVITVCGLYRTGKSYLLNLISGRIGPNATGRQPSFQTSGSVNACTNGIWIWSSSLPTSSGAPVYILVDCEGSGNIANSRDRDARLFAVAILMSSYFLYNSRGVLDDTSVSTLSAVASMASSAISGSLAQRSKPRFMWTLRDFTLSLENAQGVPISSSEYLDNVLRGKQSKQFLLQTFSSLDCTTLVTPVTEESKLQNLTDLGWSVLREEFRSQILSLRSKLFRDSRPKRSVSGDKEMTAAEFISFVEKCLESLNSGNVPKIDSVWKQVQTGEVDRVVAAISREFASQVGSIQLPLSGEALEVALGSVKKDAMKRFRSLAGASDGDAKNELLLTINTVSRETTQRNVVRAKEQSEAILRQLWREEVVGPLRSLSPTSADQTGLVRSRIEILHAKYFSQAVGPQDVIEKVYNDNIFPRVERLLVEFSHPPPADDPDAGYPRAVSSLNFEPVPFQAPQKPQSRRNRFQRTCFRGCNIM